MPIVPIPLVLMGLGAVTALVSLPLLFKWVPPNRFYGVRIPAAFRSERNWYAINAYGARRLLVHAAILVVLGLACDSLSNPPFWVPIAFLVGGLVLVFPIMGSVVRYARTLPDSDR
jgi:hypothetical protein